MYGTSQCSDCTLAKQYLTSMGLEFDFVDIAMVEGAAEEVMAINNGKRIVPTLIIAGQAHTNPSYLELKSILGLMKAS